MPQLTRRQETNNEDSIAVENDGELRDYVFCLHCHTVNSAEAEYCISCRQPLIEPASDLRDRLERISEHASHRESEERYDGLFWPYRKFLDRLVVKLENFFYGLSKPFRRIDDGLLKPRGESFANPLKPHPPLKYAVSILQQVDKSSYNPFPADAKEYAGWKGRYTDWPDNRLASVLKDLSEWSLVALIWLIACILFIGAFALFMSLIQ